MAVVEPKPDDIIFGVEMGPDVSVVATGLREDLEKCANVGGVLTRLTKHDFPSTVAFSGKIRLYGEEAQCRVNYEPKDTLVCLPMWVPVRTAADGQDVERRLTHAPLVEVTIHKGSVVFHVDVDRKKVAVPLPVVLGDFVKYLRYMGLVMNPAFKSRIGNLKGVQLRLQLQQDHNLSRHVGVIVVPAFITAKDLRVITAALAVTGIPMQVINRTSAVVNWWCCDKLPGAYEALVQLQKQQATAAGGGHQAKDDDAVRVGILDVGAADISLVILELRPGNHPDVNQEHLKKQPQQQVSVKVLAGETAVNLGFLDILRLVADKVKQYVKEHFHVEIREHTERYWKLSLACGRCVRSLCDVEESVVDIDDFVVKKTQLRMECSRKHLLNICAPLVDPYRKFLLNTLSKAGLGSEQQQQQTPLTAVYAIGTLVRIPWILEVTEEVLGHGDHFPLPEPQEPAAAADKAKAAGGGEDLKGRRLHFITEQGGQVAPYGAAYFAAGKSYIRFLQDEGPPYTDAELLVSPCACGCESLIIFLRSIVITLMRGPTTGEDTEGKEDERQRNAEMLERQGQYEMTSLEQQLTQIEHREIVRRETYSRINAYALEMRQSAFSTFPTLLQDPDRTAKVLRDAEAALTSLRDASEEQLKKMHQELRSYFEKHEPRLYEKFENARLNRLAQREHEASFDPRGTMDLLIRHIGEERDAPLPPDARLERAKRDLEEAKRLIESGQYDLGIFTAEKSMYYITQIDAKDLTDAGAKERVTEIKLEAMLQLAKAETLMAEHDRAIEQRGELLTAAIDHCTTALQIE